MPARVSGRPQAVGVPAHVSGVPASVGGARTRLGNGGRAAAAVAAPRARGSQHADLRIRVRPRPARPASDSVIYRRLLHPQRGQTDFEDAWCPETPFAPGRAGAKGDISRRLVGVRRGLREPGWAQAAPGDGAREVWRGADWVWRRRTRGPWRRRTRGPWRWRTRGLERADAGPLETAHAGPGDMPHAGPGDAARGAWGRRRRGLERTHAAHGARRLETETRGPGTPRDPERTLGGSGVHLPRPAAPATAPAHCPAAGHSMLGGHRTVGLDDVLRGSV